MMYLCNGKIVKNKNDLKDKFGGKSVVFIDGDIATVMDFSDRKPKITKYLIREVSHDKHIIIEETGRDRGKA